MTSKAFFTAVALLCTCTGTYASWTCNGVEEPNYDDCEAMITQSGWRGNTDVICPAYNDCAVFTPGDGTNCRAAWCNTNNDRNCPTYQSFVSDLDILLQYCVQGKQSGGTLLDYGNLGYSELMNNPGATSKKRSESISAAAIVQTMSVEENAAEIAALRNAQKVKARHARDFQVPKDSQVEKRDRYWIEIETDQNVEKPDSKFPIVELGAGASYTVTDTDTKTVGISVTGEAGVDAFDLFKASVSLTLEYDYTVTSTKGTIVPNHCSGNGVVYWYPLYDAYHGYFGPDDTFNDYWIPLDNDLSKLNYRVECQG